MKWLIIILVVLAILLLGALVWSVARRNRNEARRERAGELRSEAAGYGAERPTEEARARQTQAEAERARAEADQLQARAEEEQRAVDMTRAREEDAVREADRLDPDVDQQSDDYRPDAGRAHDTQPTEAPEGTYADPRYDRPEGNHRS